MPKEDDKIKNPYLDEFESLKAKYQESGGIFKMFRHREELVKKYAWSIPDDAIAQAILEHTPHRKIVDVGAGTGYWGWFLSQYGLDVVCYDIEPYHNDYSANKWLEVKKGGPESAGIHPERALLLCWPPYSDSMAAQTLKAYQGDLLIYIGEGRWGCTGDDDFHYQIEESGTWENVFHSHPVNWRGIHSQNFIYRRVR